MNSPETKAAFLNSQVACALIKAAGMTAENQVYVVQGQTPIHGEADFDKLIVEFGIHHNAAIDTLRG